MVHGFLNIPACVDVYLFSFVPLLALNFLLILLVTYSDTSLKYYSIANIID